MAPYQPSQTEIKDGCQQLEPYLGIHEESRVFFTTDSQLLPAPKRSSRGPRQKGMKHKPEPNRSRKMARATSRPTENWELNRMFRRDIYGSAAGEMVELIDTRLISQFT